MGKWLFCKRPSEINIATSTAKLDTTLKLMFKERTLGVGGWAVVGVLLDTEEMPMPTS